jgi:hypothetical protein
VVGYRVSNTSAQMSHTSKTHWPGRTQAGSSIVEALRNYRHPVFVYIPCGAELRCVPRVQAPVRSVSFFFWPFIPLQWLSSALAGVLRLGRFFDHVYVREGAEV